MIRLEELKKNDIIYTICEAIELYKSRLTEGLV